MFCDVLKAMREKAGYTQQGLADALNISRGSISMYELGKREPDYDTLRALAEVLHTTRAELLEEADPAPAQPVIQYPTELQIKYTALDSHGRHLVDLILDAEYKRCTLQTIAAPEPIYIRHYLVPAAAGAASPVVGEEYEDIPLPIGAPTGADFCITVDGDSMEPWIHDGSLAYVKRGADMQELDVGVFYVDGDVLIKQWRRDQEGTLHLLSANPKRKDANRSIPRTSTSTVICFGKVLLDHKLPAPVYD